MSSKQIAKNLLDTDFIAQAENRLQFEEGYYQEPIDIDSFTKEIDDYIDEETR